MNIDVIVSHINSYVTLNEEEVRALSSSLISKTIKQGELIVESGEPARYMIFMNAGYVMTYYTDKDGFDHVIQFASTGWWSGDLYSLSENKPTIYSTRALSAGEVLLFPKAAQDQLLDKYPKFERYFRILFHNALMRLQFRIIENYSATAESRYLSFRERFPGMEQHVSQKHIASYLGITPEFLSKTRKKLQQQ
ncbi:cAMP-binding domain of CRP or a regulatory subunit of cAMP-dependent protein kinases [Chitinophaga sp. YR573]|uniref:Crp/Fnr family transcriptional regulator n=1 Tax=Chitinophaga sp. YR573 TaxID=1881040 RepID=UPI0008B90BA3|nr:Crp/Fnr family transcriptional regulator [Chitinophaga sp. YR573]SEW05652.1 cAMP-binding domain of CRP or a regulatory subunit of cAMP-dependent protein kinases [Chitinophaga sp. YR573]